MHIIYTGHWSWENEQSKLVGTFRFFLNTVLLQQFAIDFSESHDFLLWTFKYGSNFNEMYFNTCIALRKTKCTYYFFPPFISLSFDKLVLFVYFDEFPDEKVCLFSHTR